MATRQIDILDIDSIVDPEFYEKLLKSDSETKKIAAKSMLGYIVYLDEMIMDVNALKRDLMNDRNKVILMRNKIMEGEDDGE